MSRGLITSSRILAPSKHYCREMAIESLMISDTPTLLGGLMVSHRINHDQKVFETNIRKWTKCTVGWKDKRICVVIIEGVIPQALSFIVAAMRYHNTYNVDPLSAWMSEVVAEIKNIRYTLRYKKDEAEMIVRDFFNNIGENIKGRPGLLQTLIQIITKNKSPYTYGPFQVIANHALATR